MTQLIAIACLPCLYFMYYMYKYDRLEKEPIRILLLCLLGGFLAVAVTLLVSNVVTDIEYSLFTEATIGYYLFDNFLGVALIEEGCKFLFLLLFTWRSKHYNCTYDGLIYAVFVSLGFALVENILYVISYGLETALIRALTAIPGHVADGVILGVHYGDAKWWQCSGNSDKAFSINLKGFILAVLAHGFYDFTLSIDSFVSVIVFLAFLFFLYIYIYRMVKISSQEDSEIVDLRN